MDLQDDFQRIFQGDQDYFLKSQRQRFNNIHSNVMKDLQGFRLQNPSASSIQYVSVKKRPASVVQMEEKRANKLRQIVVHDML